MSYNGKHPVQLVAELDTVLTDLSRRAGLGPLSVAFDFSGTPSSLSYGPGGVRVLGDHRPVFNVGCLLDLIVAVLCLDLHHRSGLDLDAPYQDHLPEAARAPGETITIRHLLTRTSGVQDPRSIDEMRSFVPWEGLADRIRAAPQVFSPGAVFNYGGIDRVLLNVLLERFSGRSTAGLVTDIILEPLGIVPRPDQLGAMSEDGYPMIEKFDAVHFAMIVAKLAQEDGEGGGNPFGRGLRYYLQGERLQLSRSIRAPAWPHAPTAFTLGLFRYSDGLIGFNGWDQGHACAVRFDPTGQTSFVVGLEGPPTVRDVIVAEIADRLGYGSLQSRAAPCTVGGLNGLRPQEILGAYEGWAAGYAAQVTLEADEVVCDLSYGDQPFQQIRARLEDHAWLVVDSLAQASALEFFRDPKTGRVCLASGYLPYAKLADGLP